MPLDRRWGGAYAGRRDGKLGWRYGCQYLHGAWVMNGPLRLTVLGTGYLGITHAACMATLGFEVLGVDINAGKVDQLNAGQLAIYEPGLEELLRSGLDCRRVDGRSVLDSGMWRDAGWNYRALGEALIPPLSTRFAVEPSAEDRGAR